ncbi:hypothetical protein V6N12_033077 [Hibiscus sabdariffa]|uniref:Uncharacterized protein n=1 Tax=Hibiscus sabdariffa TaxID=183260 RepID=A0ABR2BCH7_9ROSI
MSLIISLVVFLPVSHTPVSFSAPPQYPSATSSHVIDNKFIPSPMLSSSSGTSEAGKQIAHSLSSFPTGSMSSPTTSALSSGLNDGSWGVTHY